MNLTLQLDESLAMRLQTQATKQQISLTEFIHHFLNIHWGSTTLESDVVQPSVLDTEQFTGQFEDVWDDSDWDTWNSDDWIESETVEPKQQRHIRNDDAYWEEIYAELRMLDPEHEAEIDRKYGTGFDVLKNTSGLIDTGLPVEEIRYILESPQLSQQSLWVESHGSYTPSCCQTVPP